MARKPEIQYVRYYTDGSAARQLEPKTPQKQRAPRKRVRRQPVYTATVQPFAIGGLAVAAVLLVCMIVGFVQLRNVQHQQQIMADYVSQLSDRNVELRHTYDEKVDLDKVEKSALALGMIPAEEAMTITVSLPEPEPVREVTLWDRIEAFFEGLFA